MLTPSREGFVQVLDTNGNNVSQFKNCAADPGAMCLVGGSSSFGGCASASGDYVVVAQSKKPLIHLYSWGKAQASMAFHVQEVTTAICSDASGNFLFGGSKGGRIFCWQLSNGALLRVWQAHFRTVMCMKVSACNNILITCSEDGMTSVWTLADIVGDMGCTPLAAFKTWGSHTLAVKNMQVLGHLSSLKVATCSLDQTVVLYDVHSEKECFRKALPQAVESLLLNHSESSLYAGCTDGSIYILDLSIQAAALSAANLELAVLGQTNSYDKDPNGVGSLPRLEGHSACVTSMAMCIDDVTLVSASHDGTLAFWDVITRQMIRRYVPPNSSCGLSNVLICMKPEQLDIGVQKPSLLPLTHLKKYKDKNAKEKSSESDAVLPLHVYGCAADADAVHMGGLPMNGPKENALAIGSFVKLSST